MSAVSADPTTMPVALDLLHVHSSAIGRTIDTTALADVAEAQIARHATLRNGSEVAWALWAAIDLGFSLSTAAAQAVSPIEDDFVALLALHAESLGRFPQGSLNLATWDGLASAPDAMTAEHWLLAYEGVQKGWLPAAQVAVAADPFFAALEGSGVYFYDINPPFRPFTGPSARVPGGQIPAASL
jgi:hypothetical protein